MTLICLHAAAAASSAQDLIPAGSINGVLAHDRIVVVVPEDVAIRRFARTFRDRFLKDAVILDDRAATAAGADAELRGHNLIVFGTPDGNAWLRAHRERLPFEFEDGAVRLQERRFEGNALRVICAVKSPHDRARRVLVYVAARAVDVVGINEPYHGPTEWVVADGRRVLASGGYRLTGALLPERMSADLDYLVEKLRDVHPAAVDGLPEGVAAAVAQARERIGAPQERPAFWLVLNRVLLALHDAHSSVHPLRSGELVDLPIAWLSDGPVVTADTADLRRGDRLLAIGDRSTGELIDALRGVVPAENDARLRAKAETELRDLGVLRVLGIADRAPVRVVVEREGRELELAVGLAGGAAGGGAGGGQDPGAARAPWARFALDPEHDLGVFTLDQCRNEAFYRGQLEAFFGAVHEAGIGRIAVDVRDNSGGDSTVLNEFLRYVDIGSYAGYSGEMRVSVDSLRQRGGTGEPRYVRNGPRRRTNARVTEPPPFTGELFVLTSPRTFSSGNWFAVVVQDNGIGKVVGEPTGNAPSSYGDVLHFTLPESGYSFSLSFKKWVRPAPGRDPQDSVVPDHPVPRTREHVVRGVDPVLEFLRGR